MREPIEILVEWDTIVGNMPREKRWEHLREALEFMLCGDRNLIFGSIEFYRELINWIFIHAEKNHDYAGASGNFYNFIDGASFAGTTLAQQFDALIGTKISRIKNLRRLTTGTFNESMKDSYRDLGIYVALRLAAEATYHGAMNKTPRDEYPELDH